VPTRGVRRETPVAAPHRAVNRRTTAAGTESSPSRGTQGDAFSRGPASGATVEFLRGISTATVGAAALRSLRTDTPVRPNLPALAGLGVTNLERYPHPTAANTSIIVTAFAPTATAAVPGFTLDLNAKGFHERLPDRFVLGDAGLSRCFIGVDQSPGSQLGMILDAIVAELKTDPATGGPSQAAAIDFARNYAGSLIKWTAGSSFNDGRKELAWDKAIVIDESAAKAAFAAHASGAVDGQVTSAGMDFPVVPFERFLEAGEGYCIQKALLAALVLERAGVPCRLVSGVVVRGPGNTVGHNWVELQDGSIVDPARSWHEATAPVVNDPPYPRAFKVRGETRAVSATYPYLSLS